MSGRHKKKYDKSVYRSLAMILQFSIHLLVPICMMSALGIWLDNRFDTGFWTVLLFFAGALAGGQNVYKLARKVYGSSGEK